MGTDPLNPDSDGDGFGDCDEELEFATDPLDEASYPQGKYGGSGCSTVSDGPSSWGWIAAMLGFFSLRRRRRRRQ
jgi:MYXO-CTERM domain-containing protein